jgi:hypothetical protein
MAGFTVFVVKAWRFYKSVITGLYAKRGDETGGTWLILNLIRFCVRFIPVVLSVNFLFACGCPRFRVSEQTWVDNKASFRIICPKIGQWPCVFFDV